MYENLNNIQKMDDPKAREAKDLERSKDKKIKVRKASSSVSLNTLNRTLTFIKILGVLIVVFALFYVCYQGINLYLNN